MRAWARPLIGLAFTAVVASIAAPIVAAAGPPFPDPVAGQAVYDPAGAITAQTEQQLETKIDEIETRTNAEIVVYLQVDPTVSEEENLVKAKALLDQWGVGRRGFDDGLVILLGLEPDLQHGRISLFGGSGLNAAYLDPNALSAVIQDEMVPRARSGDIDGALLAALESIDGRMTSDGSARIQGARQLNAVVGLGLAPFVLLATLMFAYLAWRRQGRDPEFHDSPSILMAGPPAGMTPPLATVVRRGEVSPESLNVTLVELASQGRIAFRNLDRVSEVHSDEEPDPVTDPAILVPPEPAAAPPLAGPQAYVYDAIRGLAGTAGELRRERLWGLNAGLSRYRSILEKTAVGLGWFTQRPSRLIGRWTAIGIVELLLGLVLGFLGFSMPSSGLLLLGAALVLGGIGTVLFGRAMSQRTALGAQVDGMLKAYARTLQKTMEQARTMDQVVDEPAVRILADTPDKAVVWAIALGLRDELAAVLTRTLEDRRAGASTANAAFYPYWLGSTAASSG
ncbi:MAG: DUF2207 domain-containing protein, partial [Chloroflexota bacterium]|nr:DUF2207 domain-containing protein [Chloroflexota bacterium]